jgi:caa(3)-type oxidase subunit IV
MTHEAAHTPLDLADPHHDLHHGHVIIAPRTLISVLLVLLVFTVLTVAASRSEVWVAETFHVIVPQWVNVGGVLLIAVIKSSLVALYFMQLKYDSILNSIIFLFCIFALGLFLFFSMIDLGQRGTNYAWKSGEIQRGGMGINTYPEGEKGTPTEIAGRWPMRVDTGGKPLTQWASEKRMEEIAASGVADPKAQYEVEHELFAKHGHHHEVEMSSANRSVPRTGVTPDLFKPAPAGAPEGGGHGGH